MTMNLRHQNFMLSLRQQMGWPLFKPANDCIGFASGRAVDFEVGSDLARVAQQMGKDIIYSSWASAAATTPIGLTIAYRDMLAVHIIDRLVPYAADEQAPIMLVSTRQDEVFSIDQRGSLIRVLGGKPKNIGTGRKLAERRLKEAAATLSVGLLETNHLLPPGADWCAPKWPVDTVVRFG